MGWMSVFTLKDERSDQSTLNDRGAKKKRQMKVIQEMSIYSVMQSNHFFKTWNVKLPQAMPHAVNTKYAVHCFVKTRIWSFFSNVVCCLGTQSKCKFCAALVHPKINSYSWSWEISNFSHVIVWGLSIVVISLFSFDTSCGRLSEYWVLNSYVY